MQGQAGPGDDIGQGRLQSEQATNQAPVRIAGDAARRVRLPAIDEVASRGHARSPDGIADQLDGTRAAATDQQARSRRVNVDAIGNDLSHRSLVSECDADDPGLSVVEGAHGVEGVGDVGDTGIEGSQGLRVGGIGVAHGGNDPPPPQMSHQVQSAGYLGSMLWGVLILVLSSRVRAARFVTSIAVVVRRASRGLPAGAAVSSASQAPFCRFAHASGGTARSRPPASTRMPRPALPVRDVAKGRRGVVGLGSAGSKIAVSLVRTGVREFVLSDDDVFLPGNASRHSLDWRNLGEHKAKAVARTLEYLGPSVNVTVHTVSITGQESTAAVNRVLDQLSNCSLIIDATANAAAFNVLSAISVARSIPFVWMEVFPGGIGGMVARYRPTIDPDPKTMRLAYLRFTDDNPFPGLSPTTDYTAGGAEGNPIVATDADVSVIADYASELALDSLLRPTDSIFPFSMYLVGLRKYWVFSSPFHTIQVPTDHLHQTTRDVEQPTAEILKEGGTFLLGILQRLDSDKAPQ